MTRILLEWIRGVGDEDRESLLEEVETVVANVKGQREMREFTATLYGDEKGLLEPDEPRFALLRKTSIYKL